MNENSRVRKIEEKQARRKEIRKELKRLNEIGNVSGSSFLQKVRKTIDSKAI